MSAAIGCLGLVLQELRALPPASPSGETSCWPVAAEPLRFIRFYIWRLELVFPGHFARATGSSCHREVKSGDVYRRRISHK